MKNRPEDIVKKRTKELVMERQRLYSVLEALPAYVVLLDKDYRVPFANKIFRERFGESYGKRCYEFLFNKKEPCDECETYKVLKTNAPHRWEWNGPDGRVYDIYDYPFPEANGSTMILEMGIDITERKRAETELNKHKKHLEELVKEKTADLQEREGDLRHAQSVAHLGSWRLDVHKNELTWSEENHRIFGVKKDKTMTYETFLSAVYPDDRKYVDTKWNAAMRGEPYDIEHRIIVNGKIKWVREQAELEFDKKGKLLGGFGTTQDITARKEAAADIEKLSRFPEENPSPVLRVDKDCRVIFANNASAPLLEEWKTKIGGILPDNLSDVIKKVFIAGKIEETEIKAGEKVFNFSFAPITKQGYINLYGIDITRQKQIQKLLKESRDEMEKRVRKRTRELEEANKVLRIIKDEFERAQGVAHIGSWNLDIANNIFKWSDETYRIFGLDSGTTVNYEKFLEIVHADDREYVDRIWKDALEKKKSCDIEHRIVVNGGIKWVVAKAEIELNEEGEAVTGVGTVQDITEFRSKEESVRKLQDELTHISRVTTMGELTAALAHELNQPLMAIMSNAQAARRFLLRENPDLDEFREILSDIIEDDKRASEVINRLRALLRKSDPEFKILNINVIIREVISLLHSDLIIKGISLNSELDENIPFVKGDRIQLQQVILNLALNSCEAMKDSDVKKLCVRSMREDSKFVAVGIEDTGTGIDDKNINRLFEPFFTTKKEGMGMGLSINKTIIESHGGALRAENNIGGGASFYFTLPVLNGRDR
ncbi:PAS domain-containing protein [bacterium]|nr:PAS domain-containing protein [bacterium]